MILIIFNRVLNLVIFTANWFIMEPVYQEKGALEQSKLEKSAMEKNAMEKNALIEIATDHFINFPFSQTK